MSERIEVCPEEELPPGERKVVEAGRTSIGVFNINGEYFALLNSCMHQYGPICEGQLMPTIEGEYVQAGQRVKEWLSEDNHMIRCPWHGWTYDVMTGKHTGDTEISIPTFDVESEDGTLYVKF